MKYAITLTLNPKLYRMIPDDQFIKMSQIIDELRDYKISIVAELTQQQNVHAHGTIDIEGNKDLKNFWNIIRGLQKGDLGKMICLKQITNEPQWIEYLKKDLKLTKEICNADPWYKDDFSYRNTIFKLSSDGTIYID